MKCAKLFVWALTLVGGLTVARATTVNFSPSGMGTIDGTYYYTWGVNWSLPSGDTITSATLTYNNLKLTSFGYNDPAYVWTHLLNTSSGTGTSGVITRSDNDSGTDAFAGNGVLLGQRYFYTLNSSQTFSYDLDLTTLTSYAADGHFAIGIDPDCHYSDSSIVLSITYAATPSQQVPDAGSTAAMLSLALPLLGLFRRK